MHQTDPQQDCRPPSPPPIDGTKNASPAVPTRPGYGELTLSCVIPAFNEEASLPTVVPQVIAALQELAAHVEVVIVNDGSADCTGEVARSLCERHSEVIVVDLSRNFGKEAALTAGLDIASGNAVILMDADGQHPVSALVQMVRIWREGVDVVYAIRSSRDDQSKLQAYLTTWFYRLINWKSRIRIPSHAGDFRLMDRQVVNALAALPERNRFMKGLYAWVGFKSVAIQYKPLPRRFGQTRFGFRGALALATTGMLAFSTAPLRLLTLFGLCLAFIALTYGAWVVASRIVWGIEVPGYATIVASVMFFSGVQLFGMGIIAAYIARIYEEVKQRPLYLISKRYGTRPEPEPTFGSRTDGNFSTNLSAKAQMAPAKNEQP
jgi:polyisoprenyl-phosphate glycosyltransferase